MSKNQKYWTLAFHKFSKILEQTRTYPGQTVMKISAASSLKFISQDRYFAQTITLFSGDRHG